MGFAAADVAAGVAEMLAAHGVATAGEEVDGRWVFQARDVRITVGPLPEDRRTLALFQPRCLLVLSGNGPVADALTEAIRVKFLRVTG
jgi:hypothetical protein